MVKEVEPKVEDKEPEKIAVVAVEEVVEKAVVPPPAPVVEAKGELVFHMPRLRSVSFSRTNSSFPDFLMNSQANRQTRAGQGALARRASHR